MFLLLVIVLGRRFNEDMIMFVGKVRLFSVNIVVFVMMTVGFIFIKIFVIVVINFVSIVHPMFLKLLFTILYFVIVTISMIIYQIMLILLWVILTFTQLTYEDYSSIALSFISHLIVDQLIILISGSIMLTSYLIVIKFQLVVLMPLFLMSFFVKVTLFIVSKNPTFFEDFDTFHSIIQYPPSKIILLTLITKSNL